MVVPHFSSILVPMKLGIIGEEMVATAVKLASEHGARVEAMYVISVPMELALDGAMPERGGARGGVARGGGTLGRGERRRGEHEHDPRARRSAARSLTAPRELDADLIVLGSSPRWRRQSRFFSPTVDFVLRHAPCEVLIVAFPQRVLDEELAAT